MEITDDFGRTRLVRKSVAEARQATKEAERGPGLVSEDMKREQERLKWEEEARAEHGLINSIARSF
jgi:hypothetical protein